MDLQIRTCHGMSLFFILAQKTQGMNKLFFLLGAALLISCSDPTRFVKLDSGRTGIDFNNSVTESDSLNILNHEYLYNGAGIGTGDLNNDGLTDLVFAGNQVSSRVYLNTGNFRFRDITPNLKGLSNDQWYSGVALADVNNDGWLDIYLTSTSGNSREKNKNRLWINGGCEKDQDPVFTEKAEEYGIACDDRSVAAAFFDYDLDGFTDLYVLNNEITYPAVSTYRPKITDGTSPNNDRLYHNNGNGTFTDVTLEAGILIEGFGMGLAISDLNKDGYPDIYISNDLLANDVMYINQGDGTFRNEIGKYISYQSRTSKGNDVADINGDGNPDIFTLDMMPDTYHKKKQTINGFNYNFYSADNLFGYEHQYQRNMLQLHNGFMNGRLLPFSESARIMHLSETDWSWSPLIADFDNDGDRDLLVTTGFPRDLRDKDWTKIKASAAGSLTTEKALSEMAPPLLIPNAAFENNGDSGFTRKNDWLPKIPSFSSGAVFADLDNDGDLDYVVNNINDKAGLFRNKTVEKAKGSANYLRIRLKGQNNNPMALGAKIELWYNGKIGYYEHFLTRGYASSVDPVVHFGLSGLKVVDSIRIIWPFSANISVLKNIEANQTIEINYENSAVAKKIPEIKEPTGFMFRQRDSILDYLHLQDDFNDFIHDQEIIPHKFSQIGPCLAKGDIDGDGTEDIVTGSTLNQPSMVYLRRGDKFQAADFEIFTTRKKIQESDIAIIDYDNDGDNDIIAVAGGYENQVEDEYRHLIYENRKGKFISHPLNATAFPASVIRPCDFDNDGDMDLFIGSRVKKGMFPYANHSWILINKNGSYSADPVFRLNLGMVTDAVWTDYDKDGWKDLLVARDWNSIVLMRNDSGKTFVPEIIPEIESRHGLWYSLTAADLDGDGDDDYVAGNLGENNRFTLNDIHPLRLYAIDLEPDGIIDPLITAFYEDKNGTMTEYPVNYLDELWSQSPFMEGRCKDYTSFSYLDFNQLIPEAVRKGLKFSLFVNTTSSCILWNDNGSIRWERLPWKAQLSPLTRIIIRDLNRDSLPDIIAAGNDYSWDLATGYLDGNKGLVLMNETGRKEGKSNASFRAVGSSESGFLANGMAGSMLWMEGKNPLMVVGINRGKALVFEPSAK